MTVKTIFNDQVEGVSPTVTGIAHVGTRLELETNDGIIIEMFQFDDDKRGQVRILESLIGFGKE